MIELTAEVDLARRMGFTISRAADALSVQIRPGMPLDDLLDAILAGAMDTPTAVTSDQFNLVYRLRGT